MIKVKSFNDVITNSSSECFIIKTEDLDKLNLSGRILNNLVRIDTIDDLINKITNGEIDTREYISAFNAYIFKQEPLVVNKYAIEALRDFGHTEEEIKEWKERKINEIKERNKGYIESYKKDPRIIRTVGFSYIWNYGGIHDLMNSLKKKLEKKHIKYKEIPW